MQVNTENLSAFLDTIPNHKRFLIAYSGGMDSHVLLHLMVCLGREGGFGVRAVPRKSQHTTGKPILGRSLPGCLPRPGR